MNADGMSTTIENPFKLFLSSLLTLIYIPTNSTLINSIPLEMM